jgi:hypothetical protein
LSNPYDIERGSLFFGAKPPVPHQAGFAWMESGDLLSPDNICQTNVANRRALMHRGFSRVFTFDVRDGDHFPR